jgi:hypothetical protein
MPIEDVNYQLDVLNASSGKYVMILILDLFFFFRIHLKLIIIKFLKNEDKNTKK